jgi:alkylation response protein AidB-like acyl-CoA dehydrogenase
MLLALTPDQESLRETTDRFLAKEMPASSLRAARHDPAGFNRGFWRAGADLGWTSLLVSEAAGGGSVSGRGLVDLSLLAFEFGRHASPGPLGAANAVASALGEDPGEVPAEVLAGIVSGHIIPGWAHEERGRFGSLGVTIEPAGAEVTVRGLKRPVESAAQAEWLLVSGVTGNGRSLVLVPSSADGVSIEPLQSADLTRRFATVAFDGVRVPLRNVVGEPAGAGPALDRLVDQALVVNCAESVGALQAGFDLTVEWAFDRYSFGRPLASYQALKHRFADMKAWLEASHALSDEAALAVDGGQPDGATLAAAAKAFVGHYGGELLQDCVQIHGGIGVTFEHDLHLYLRRLSVNRMLLGSPADHRLRLGDTALAEVAAPGQEAA